MNADVRTLQYVAGCHAREVRESLQTARRHRTVRGVVASQIALASYCARLAWRVALAIESASTPQPDDVCAVCGETWLDENGLQHASVSVGHSFVYEVTR